MKILESKVIKKIIFLITMILTFSSITNAAVTTFTVTQDTANPVPSGGNAVYSVNIATTSAYTNATAEVIFPAEFKTITPAVVSQIPGTTSTVTTLADGRIKVTYTFPSIPAGTSAIVKINGVLKNYFMADNTNIYTNATLYDNASSILATAPEIATIVDSNPGIDLFTKDVVGGSSASFDIRNDRSRPVTYSLLFRTNSGNGARLPGKIIITDTLPVGGVYVAGSSSILLTGIPSSCLTYGEPTYNTTSNVLTWEIDNSCTNIESFASGTIKYNVLYPTANNNDVVKNNAAITVFPPQTATDATNNATKATSLSVKLVFGTGIIPADITKKTASNSTTVNYLKTANFPYTITNENKTLYKYEFHQVTDEAPTGTEILGFRLADGTSSLRAKNTTPLTVEYKDSSGNWITFATYPFDANFSSTNVTFATLGITGVKGLRYTTAMDPQDSNGKTIIFRNYINLKITDPSTYTSSTVTNTATSCTSYTVDPITSGSGCGTSSATYNVIDEEPLRASVYKAPATSTNLIEGSTLNFTLSIDNAAVTDKGIMYPIAYDLLPVGLEYTAGSSKLRLFQKGGTSTTFIVEPQVIFNYNGTGRTLLIWKTDNLPFTAAQSSLKNNFETNGLINRNSATTEMITWIPITYNTVASAFMKSGASINESYADSDVSTLYPATLPAAQKIVDTYDVNGNSNATETLAYSKVNLTYTPNLAFYGEKNVMSETETAYTSASTVPAGGNYKYRLRVVNNSLTETTQTSFGDVLPYSGNTDILSPYSNRNSVWSGSLIAPITVSDSRFQVYYTTTVNPKLADQLHNSYVDAPGTQTATWSTTPPADLSTVTGFVIKQTTGIFTTGNYVEAIVEMKAEDDYTLAPTGSKAINKFAYSALDSTGTNYIPASETNLVSVAITRYSFGDFAWKDLNDNGIQDTGEVGVAGVKVDVYDSTNTLVKTATSDSTGKYSITDINPGTYTVKVTPATGDAIGKQTQGTDTTKDSDIDPTTKTGTITIGSSNRTDFDIAIIKSANPTVVGTKALTTESITTNKIAEKGEVLTYTITLDNSAGTNDAVLVAVKDSLLASLPTGITLSSAPVASAGTLTTNAIGDYTLDTVAKGTTVTVTYKLQITSDATEYKALGSNIVNVITTDGSTPVVPTDPTDPTNPCLVAKTCTVTPTNATVAGTKALTAESITTNKIAEKGEVLTYTITLDNSAGTNDAVLVAVKDSLLASLPTGITLSSGPTASTGTLTTNAIGDYTLDKVAKGTTVTVTYKLQITSDATEYKALGSNVVNVITTDGSTPVVPTDPTDPTNPCLVAKTCTVTPTNATVVGTKALTTESITTNKIAEKGEVLTYTITLDNSAGTNDAVLVAVKDSLLASLPTGITLSSAPVASAGTLTTNAIGDYTLDTVAKGTTVTVTYKLQITSDATEYKALGSNIVNVITTDGSTPVVPTDPTDPTNPCLVAKTCTVTPTNATVAGTKALTAESITTNKIAEKGEVLTYTITLDNSAGTNDAVLVAVKDSLLASLPTGITLSSGPTASTGTLTTNAIGDYTLDKVAKGTTVTVTYKLQITSDATEYKALGSNVVNVITTDGSTPVVPTDPTDPTNPCLVAKTCTVTPTNATVVGTKALTTESITTNKIAEKGEVLTYTITLDNSAGTNDAVLVAVKDSLLASLPTGITLSSAPVASAGTLTTNAIGDYTLDTVAKGTTVTVTYKLQITSDATEYKALGSNIVNVITTDGSTPVVPTDPTDPTNPCLVAKTCTVTPTNATVAGTKALTAESITTNKIAEKGEVLTYTITLDNSAGTNDAVLVAVKDSLLASLPTGITLSSGPTASTGTLTTNAIGDYTLDKVAKGTTVTVTYKLQITSDATEYKALGSNVVNVITTDGSTPVVPTDPTDPTNPCIIAKTCTVTPTNATVAGTKALTAESITTNKIAEKGEVLTYTITLDNSAGTNDAVLVPVKDSLLASLPTGITLSSGPTASTGTLAGSAGNYTLDKVAKGTLTTITYKLQVTSDAAEYKALGSNVVNAVTTDGSTPVVPTDPTDPKTPCVVAKACTVTPTNPAVTSVKSLITESIKKDGLAQRAETLTYQVVLTNSSTTNDAVNVTFKDSLLTTIPAGVTVSEPTVSSGTITKVSTGVYTVDKISKGSTATVTYTVTLPKTSTEFKALGKYLINVVTSDGTDPVQPTDPTNPNEPCVLDKTCLVIPIKPESGQLTITKSASKSEVKVGDILGYTVTAINNSDSDVENAIIADMMPLGIVMIDGSSTYTLYTSTGTVKEKGSITPTKNGSLMMYPFALIQPGEKVVIKYSTRIGAGVTVGGKYTNYAIGVTPTDDDPKTGDPFIDEIVNKIEATKSEQEKVISNTGTATVYVVEDKDFDNIPVIGKVFHDRDGDGYQDEAIARGVKVTLSGDNNNPVTIDTLGRTLVIKDTTKSIYVGKIEGITTTSELSGEGNKVVLRRMVDPNNIGDITITTSEGTNVTLKADGTTVSDNKGKVLKGDNNQDIAISRKVLSNQEMVVDTETVKETKVISNIVDPVHFDSGKSEIKADYLAKLDETLKSLKGKENVRIVAVGYTDSQKLSSTSKYKNNNELSEDRARQVADYLAKELNLSPDSIETEGRGESNPVVPNVAGYGEATRANRRTEIEIRYDEVVESKVPAQKVKVKGYMEEITIKNLGLQEEGIPGVRLITPEGQIIETDQYGRYHIPRVENIGEKGRNVIVKVDSITLPKGSIFTTENPRVKWVTPYLINDFNFGVQFKEDGGAK